MIRLLLLSIFSTSLFAAECPIFYKVDSSIEFSSPIYKKAVINVCSIKMAEKTKTHDGINGTKFHFYTGPSVSFLGHEIYDAIETIRLSATNIDCSVLLRVAKPNPMLIPNFPTGSIIFDACNISMHHVRDYGQNVIRSHVDGLPFSIVNGEKFYNELNGVLSPFMYAPTAQ